MKAFNELMGYPMESIDNLVERAKEISRTHQHIVNLNKRDLQQNGIEND